MSTVSGVLNIGGGVPPVGTWGEVAAVAPFFGPTSGDFVLPVAAPIQVASDGSWSVDLVAVPDGIAWVFRFVTKNGEYINRRIVIVPNSGTFEYGELVDAETPDAPMYGAPAWVQSVQDAAQDAVAAAAAVVANNDTITKALVQPGSSSQTKASLDATYVAIALVTDGITYNADGSVATSTVGGVTTTYTYNVDGTVHTETRLGKVKTWTYDSNGNPTGSAVV